MEVCGLPKARPISCNDCPDFQRLQISVLCVGESLDRFPSFINTILKQHVYQMVLHRPIECTAFIRRLRWERDENVNHKSGVRTFQAPIFPKKNRCVGGGGGFRGDCFCLSMVCLM